MRATFRTGSIGALALLLAAALSGCQHAGKLCDPTENQHGKHHRRPAPAGELSVTVSGLVKSDGRFLVGPAGITLEEALELADGLQGKRSFADSRNLVFLSVVGRTETTHYSLALFESDPLIRQITLRPGDTLTVQEWTQTDLTRGSKVRPNLQPEAQVPADPILWLFAQPPPKPPVQAVQFRQDLEKLSTAKEFENARQKLLTLASDAAIRRVKFPLELPEIAKPELRSKADVVAFAQTLKDFVLAVPIASDVEVDWDYLKGMYEQLKVDTSKPFPAPVNIFSSGVYPQIGRLQPVELADPDPDARSHPSLGDVGNLFRIGDDPSVLVLERDIDDRSHSFVMVNRGRGPLKHVLLLPGDRVTVTQSRALPNVLVEFLRPAIQEPAAGRAARRAR